MAASQPRQTYPWLSVHAYERVCCLHSGHVISCPARTHRRRKPSSLTLGPSGAASACCAVSMAPL